MRRVLTGALLVMGLGASSAQAWDSAQWANVTHATHSYLTEFGIDQLNARYPEFEQYRQQLIDGANTELHELELGMLDITEAYGIDLEAERIKHKGTNEGTDDIAGWWQEAVDAYAAGNKEHAYFYLGVMLHMIEDMGVPAHAHGLYHQGFSKDFDNFEFMALSNWRPDAGLADGTVDPEFDEPWRYYAFSREWTLRDAPDYPDIDFFSKTWTFASDEERQLLGSRQLHTAVVVTWALNSAARAFGM